MKKVPLFFLAALTLIGCGKSNQGELVGVKQKKFYPQKPHGMALIPGGSYIMGSSDEDIIASNDNPTQTVTLRSFWMDETEITNAEYKQFVEWVQDSIIKNELTVLALEVANIFSMDGFPNQDEFKEMVDAKPLLKFLPEAYIKEDGDDDENEAYLNELGEVIYFKNYSSEIDTDDFVIPYFTTNEKPDNLFHYSLPLNDVEIDRESEEFKALKDFIYLPEKRWFNSEPKIDVKKLKYRFSSVNLDEAIKYPENPEKYTTYQAAPIYPDTTVWIKDFKYSYNEPMHNDYFSHSAYADFPVVGVSWYQARAFAHWRTKMRNDYLRSRKKRKSTTGTFRLPTEAEWEYAARGGLESAIYPWGGPYLTDDRGCFMANFKPRRGDYAADMSLYTVEANSYEPNDYGLYNMSGNVSEWTHSTYTKDTYEYTASMNPNYSNLKDKQKAKKVIRGGSWKDVAYYLRVATRDYEYADATKSYIGFRLVRDELGSNEVE
jgi:formylglycine-generating enzyme required for sulfatase activity